MIVGALFMDENIDTRVVKCYDNNNNEIIGLGCIDEYDKRMQFIALGVLFVIIAVAVYPLVLIFD